MNFTQILLVVVLFSHLILFINALRDDDDEWLNKNNEESMERWVKSFDISNSSLYFHESSMRDDRVGKEESRWRTSCRKYLVLLTCIFSPIGIRWDLI